MRIRSIKPEFWKSEKVAGLPRDSRLLFIGLWNLADDAGRFRAHPNLIQGELFPYEPQSDIAAWLQPLVDAGLVLLYEADGRRYGLVVGFSEHQKIDRRQESRLPAPPAARRPKSHPANRSQDPLQPAAAKVETPDPADHSEESADKSAEPADCSAEPADKSGADWIRDQGGDQGKEQAQTRAGAREGRQSLKPPNPDPEPDTKPRSVAPPSRRAPSKPAAALRSDDGATPVSDLTTALMQTRYRATIGNAIARRGEVRIQAERMVATGLTPAAVDELVGLAMAKANQDDYGGLLAHWLDQNLWREVLDERESKHRAADAKRRGAAARAADACLDAPGGECGTISTAADRESVEAAIAHCKPVGAA